MNITYHVVTDKMGAKEQALEVCNRLAGNWQIVSAVPTAGAVHYILVEQDLDPAMAGLPQTAEDRQAIRDNLDVEDRVENEDNE